MKLPERLAAIKARCEAATPGPWTSHENHEPIAGVRCNYSSKRDQLWRDWIAQCQMMPVVGQQQVNAEFIAHARQDLPLVVEALELALEALQYVNSVRDRKCQSEQCTCAYDTAQNALIKIERLLAGGGG